MRIHTDHPQQVSRAVYRAAADLSGVYPEITFHGSRSRAGAIELGIAAEHRKGRRPRNFGNGEYGATWDEWGVVFAALFDADPDATCYAYDGRDDYHYKTGDRFRHGLPDEPHDQHRWNFAAPRVNSCTVCGAIRRA